MCVRWRDQEILCKREREFMCIKRARDIKKDKKRQRKGEERGNKGRTFLSNKKNSILFFLYIAC